ncbi:hypothetical protein CYY_000132 [Polysphondylium violaceum]|uniref:NAD(P)-binding domain-containing protein n=1 Tax=Polysphondylium violaceum TaxID=133409 RepID=A0A8J4Q548_9MYCE|nr:hypothetical protein CYY_000132 [Polysphondylium violaceum]
MKENVFDNVLLITGGAGFIGSHLTNYLVRNYPNYRIIVLDKIDYCSNLKNIHVYDYPNFKFYKGNILDQLLLNHIFLNEKIDIVFHLAAYSHVDNSFFDSIKFTENNIMGTHYLLEMSKQYSIQKFIYVSTDEVYGGGNSISDNSNNSISNKVLPANENITILKPTNPYSASKAGAEQLVSSYYHSFQLPIIITRGNNTYGPFQYPEKIIPKFIYQLNDNKPCTIHGTGENKRSFIYIDDMIKAFDIILKKGLIGETYNIGTDFEISNLDVANTLISLYKNDIKNNNNNKNIIDNQLIRYIPDRPFNDYRYFINCSKLKNLGWQQSIPWEMGIKLTFDWYTKNKNYWSTTTTTTSISAPDPITFDKINKNNQQQQNEKKISTTTTTLILCSNDD